MVSIFLVHIFIFIGVYLLYNVVLFSAVQQRESVIRIHISSPSWDLLLPPHPTPLGKVLFIVYYRGFPNSSVGKEFSCKAGDTGYVGSILGLGRSPRSGNGKPFQYSCLKNPLDRRAWWAIVQRAAKSWIQLNTSTWQLATQNFMNFIGFFKKELLVLLFLLFIHPKISNE